MRGDGLSKPRRRPDRGCDGTVVDCKRQREGGGGAARERGHFCDLCFVLFGGGAEVLGVSY